MKSTKFFISMLAVFLVRVKPASTNAKPGCIKNTSIAASNIQTVLTPEINWATVSVADVSSAGISVAAITSVVTTAALSAVTAVCAYISVARQQAMSIARAIHSFVKLRFIYLSIISLIFSCTCILLVIEHAAQ